MENNDVAKNLLTDRICKTCKHNGLYSPINYMQLSECHYWYHKYRLHEKAINPPRLSDDNTCDKWEEHI